jgi:hypothetical protein
MQYRYRYLYGFSVDNTPHLEFGSQVGCCVYQYRYYENIRSNESSPVLTFSLQINPLFIQAAPPEKPGGSRPKRIRTVSKKIGKSAAAAKSPAAKGKKKKVAAPAAKSPSTPPPPPPPPQLVLSTGTTIIPLADGLFATAEVIVTDVAPDEQQQQGDPPPAPPPPPKETTVIELTGSSFLDKIGRLNIFCLQYFLCQRNKVMFFQISRCWAAQFSKHVLIFRILPVFFPRFFFS